MGQPFGQERIKRLAVAPVCGDVNQTPVLLIDQRFALIGNRKRNRADLGKIGPDRQSYGCGIADQRGLFCRIARRDAEARREGAVPGVVVFKYRTADRGFRGQKFPVSASNDQPDLFTDYEAAARQEAAEKAELEKEKTCGKVKGSMDLLFCQIFRKLRDGCENKK